MLSTSLVLRDFRAGTDIGNLSVFAQCYSEDTKEPIKQNRSTTNRSCSSMTVVSAEFSVIPWKSGDARGECPVSSI